jgi:predicted  nucleic acid-binding Zn-ribbon protein
MHQAVLKIQREVKGIKIEMEGFKAQISEMEHNIESITNPGPEFKAIRPSQLDLEMDMVNDTYGQYGSFANVDEENNSFSQSSTDNSRNYGPTNSHVMKDILAELENKDNKINSLEVKINELVSTLNSLVSKTNDH